MVNPLLSSSFIVLFVFAGIIIVITTLKPMIGESQSILQLTESEQKIKTIENYIEEIRTEPIGAKRRIEFENIMPKIFIDSKADEIYTEHRIKGESIAYGSRKEEGNFIRIGGNDVSCSDVGSFFKMENSHIRVYIQDVNCSTAGCLDTSLNIKNITQKDKDVTISFVNSSVVLNNDYSTATGTGYSQLLRAGTDLPLCTVHFSVNSTKDYDIFYTLYAGADFLDIRIENIRE